MIFDVLGNNGTDPFEYCKTKSLALLDSNGDKIDYSFWFDTVTGEVERYLTDGNGHYLLDLHGNPRSTKETYPAPLRIVDINDFNHIYYMEGPSSSDKEGCTCSTHSLMWGGCTCGWIDKERAVKANNE